MKVLQLVLAGALLAALSSSGSAQQAMNGYPPGMAQGPYAGNPAASGYLQAGSPQMAYPQAMPSQMGYPQPYPGQQMGNPQPYPGQQMGYPQAMPAGYPMMDPSGAQQALYGPATPMNGDPLPMNGNGGGMGGMACGPGCGGPNPAQCFDDGTTHYAYGSAEVFYARRNTGLIHQTTILNGTTALANTSEFNFPYEPGIKAQAGYMFGNGIGIETDYWGQWAFTSRQTANGDNNLTIPGDLPLASLSFVNADRIQQTYSSHIDNYEINCVLPYASVQYLAGFRYLAVNERFNLNSFDSDTGTGDYTVLTRNRLYGGQLGGRAQWQIERFTFDIEGKAGVFYNAAHQDQTVNDAGFLLRESSGGEHQVAFVGEVSSYLWIPLGTHFTGRLGYTAVWIDQLALAPNQLDFTDTTTSGTGLYARSNILIHGFNAGIEARW